MKRFDMHAAFRTEVREHLKIRIENTDEELKNKYSIFRPRVGIFVQAEECSLTNLSGEYIIPTFTCNFLAESFDDAHIRMKNIMKFICEDEILKKNFLRVRAEGQLPAVKYDPTHKTLSVINENIEPIFPQEVFGDEYYDSHIHLYGIATVDQYIKACMYASEFSMPVITNILKEVITPFITVRWYNTTLPRAIENLKEIHENLYPKMLGINVNMKLIPELEMTKWDPECQVTDKGWMPTPKSPFKITEKYCVPSSICCKTFNLK